MLRSPSRLVLILMLLACLASFTWATQKFFVRQKHTTLGLRITFGGALLFGVLHLVVLCRMPEMKPVLIVVAVFLYSLALMIFWSAIKANRGEPLSACFSENEPLHLVRHGPYRILRHPFYVSYLLTWLSGAVATLNLWLALSFLAMCGLYVKAAREEERKFEASPLAHAYVQYRLSVGGFLPNPLKLLRKR